MFKSNSSKRQRRRKTIGFIINFLHHRYQSMICPGIMDGAIKRDYNLIAFVGKSLNSPSIFETQENVIYKLACENNIDGLLIMTGAIGNNIELNELKNFCQQYNSLPIVCVSTPIEGIPSVWVDNKSGMRELVTHFVKDHNYKRIAFIRGPSNNPEAEIRYKVFTEVLSENNIPVIPKLIFEGDFIWFSGREGIKTILDKRKAKFDAVLAANDEMLVGVYRELISRGIRIPEEVALGGFDDINETRIITPQITTVSQPLYEEGIKALEILADIIEGKSVPELFTFPSRLIIRQSCGCQLFNYSGNLGKDPDLLANKKQDIIINKVQRDIIIEQLIKDAELQSSTPKDYKENQDLIRIYFNSFIEDLENRNNHKFIDSVSKLTNNSQENNFDFEFFKILISKIYKNVSPFLINSLELTSRANELFNDSLSMLLESISRYNQNRLVQSRDYNWAMINVTKTLSTTYDLKSLRDVILKLLPTLNISFCFIALYETSNESVLPTTQSSVFLNFQNGHQNYDYQKNLLFDSRQLIPDELLDVKKRYCLAVFPLVTENDHFGFIAFNYDHKRDPIIYETLQGHISASLKSAILLETVKKQSEDLYIQKDEQSKSLKNLRAIMGGFINAMSLVVEARDPYTAGHQVRVANLARAIATEMGLPKDQIEGIRVSGVLHDLGKLYIPSQILNKPGRLLDEEFSLIKIHPQIGYNILKSVDFPWPIDKIVLQHHERIDGSGYPAGLKGKQILIEAQIICVADVVEAMASHRPYRPAPGIDKALEEISRNRGKLYDEVIVDCCIKLFKEKGFNFDVPVGSFQYPQTAES